MSDSEDDYMSDKLLIGCQEDIRPGLLFSREKRKHEQFKKKIETKNKRQKSVRELENENRDIGLNTALSTENKGFKLLEKMGFKAGEGLGKSKTGLKEPININLKQGTSGVGRETHIKDVINRRQQIKVNNLKAYESQFHMANREKSAQWVIRKDFFKAQKICEELDFRNNITDPLADFFWTKQTIEKRRKAEKQLEGQDTDSSEDDEEFELYINEENLFAVIDYIRSRHLYCLYCVITGSDEEDLKENCPGPYRRDHDDGSE